MSRAALVHRSRPAGDLTLELWYVRDGRLVPTRRTRPAPWPPPADGVASVRLAAVADPVTARLREAQVVYTLTQFPTVRQVDFGTAAPAGRAAHTDLLPPIVVTGPVIGDRVNSPVTVTGSADVFEGTVSVRVLDAAGRQLATAFTTATCGTGCRGAYRVAVRYRLPAAQAGTIEVYEVSADDGSRTKVVAVPVTLAAAR